MPHKKSVSTRTTPSAAAASVGPSPPARADDVLPAHWVRERRRAVELIRENFPSRVRVQESQSPLSKLTKSVQSSLPSQRTKKLKNISNGGHGEASARRCSRAAPRSLSVADSCKSASRVRSQ